jgi:outer membrane autotransporter protein
VLKPAAHLGYTYDVISDAMETSSTFTGGTASFKTTGAEPAKSAFNAGLGLTYSTSANWDLAANYDYTYKADYSAHSGIIRATSHF